MSPQHDAATNASHCGGLMSSSWFHSDITCRPSTSLVLWELSSPASAMQCRLVEVFSSGSWSWSHRHAGHLKVRPSGSKSPLPLRTLLPPLLSVTSQQILEELWFCQIYSMWEWRPLNSEEASEQQKWFYSLPQTSSSNNPVPELCRQVLYAGKAAEL